MILYDDEPIEGFIVGVPWTIRRKVIDLPFGQNVTDAWFTIKENIEDLDASAIVAKHITVVDDSNAGEIEDNGAGTQVAIVRFKILASENLNMQEHVTYYYDVWVKMNTGDPGVPGRGAFRVREPVRRAIV